MDIPVYPVHAMIEDGPPIFNARQIYEVGKYGKTDIVIELTLKNGDVAKFKAMRTGEKKK